ncbi:MAG: hypothetical protein HUU35_13045 [Armatimonadetes bacterium]|nr:hypothetical protein [Armatimonadota bacterium]
MAHEADDMDAAFAAAAGGCRVRVRRGRKAVAVVPLEDLQRLEELDSSEDRLLGDLADSAKQEWETAGKPTIAWDDVKRAAGLD